MYLYYVYNLGLYIKMVELHIQSNSLDFVVRMLAANVNGTDVFFLLFCIYYLFNYKINSEAKAFLYISNSRCGRFVGLMKKKVQKSF